MKSWVRVTDNGEGRKVVPIFEAFQKKLPGFREQNLVSTFPATQAHGPNIGGAWYVNRHELAPQTEVLLEYAHRDPHSAFGEETEYLLLVMDPNAPLYQLRLDLPRHHLSAVPYVFFTGRFEIVTSDDQLAEPDVWMDYFDLLGEEGIMVSDILDSNSGDKFFFAAELEPRMKSTIKVKARVTQDGKKIMKIRRGRRIKTK